MKLLPLVVLKLLVAAGKRAADAPGGRGDGDAVLGAQGEGRCSAPSAGHLVGPVFSDRRAPTSVRGDQGSGRGV